MLKLKYAAHLFFIGALLSAFLPGNVSATVGGPTFIERLSYSPKENALYYVVRDQGGRGCPPEVIKLDLSSRQSSVVLSCEEIEEKYYTADGFNSSDYEQFVQSIFSPLTILSAVGLANNDISASVEYVGEHRYDEYNVSSDFRAVVFQGDTEKGKFDFIGCYEDQPNVFRGYPIPNSRMMAIVMSGIGDCFEGGYVRDSLSVLEGVDIKDSTELGGYYSNSSGPSVHRGDLVVSAQKMLPEPVIPFEEPNDQQPLIVWGIIALVASLCVGFVIGRMRKGKDQL